MTTKFFPNGVGGTLGDVLATCRPLQVSGNVWYVSSLIGTDAASPAGQNREKPLATLAQAQTNATNDDVIVFLQGHTETFTAQQTLSKRLTLVGEGTVAGKPGVSFLMNAAAAVMFNVTGTDFELRNIYFPAQVQSNTSLKIQFSGDNPRVIGCYFECGAYDRGFAINTGSNGTRIRNTTFISTATSRAAQPLGAIRIDTNATLTNFELEDVVVSAGAVGFSNYSAIDLSNATSMGRTKITNLSLLLGADIDMGGTTAGWCNVQLATGGSRCIW